MINFSIFHDDETASQVVEFTGAATQNGYRLRQEDGTNFNETEHKILQWSMKYSESFVVYVAVQTTLGFRYLYYTPVASSNLGDGSTIHHGLGTSSADGSWHTFTRDLSYDLKDAQPDNELLSVQAFLIRGSGRIDNISLHSSLPDDLDSDGDTITDIAEITSYHTDPYLVDTDGDGLADGEELAYWGSAWNKDYDGDGIINLLDIDSDGDSVADGREVHNGANAADNSSTPSRIIYEDGEDGTIAGWDVYDSDPPGAFIDNIYDESRDSRVISLSGDALNNGYRLRNNDSGKWNETAFNVLQWSQAFTEKFIIYIGVDTAQGFRYLYYTPVDYDNPGTATYIHHGLGSDILTGEWFTFVRDLEYDLRKAEPDNTIIAVQSFLIRGSGKVDDIVALQTIPAEQDSDKDGLNDLAEINTYTTDPYSSDSDGDAIDDNAEAAYWGKRWNEDTDGDGLINILDPDSDNDSFTDGIELENATDPGDALVFPDAIIYEDGEDNKLPGWDIYAMDLEGGAIKSIYDAGRSSNVISLTGNGINTGFRLRTPSFDWWYDNMFTKIRWSMNFNSSYVVYITAQTRDGFRYLYYTPSATNQLGDGPYIHHGLGSGSIDGSWQTITRDLQADLKEAQPDNELEYIQGFLIRGSGMVDDIMTVK